MFRCIKAPSEPSFPANLAALGFTVQDGQFVDDEGKHFNYYHTDNERVNDLRKEAIHICAREVVAAELKEKYGIHQLFLAESGDSAPVLDRPNSPHVTLLATEPSKLREKKEVIVVVGEAAAGQDAGIWAYRMLMREGGLGLGSAIGLAAKLAAIAASFSGDDTDKDSAIDGISAATAQHDLDVTTQQQQKAHDQASPLKIDTDIPHPPLDTTPGLLILNGGQLLYSHLENKPMSLSTWQARPRKTALDDDYEIDESHNRVEGHRDSLQHTMTVFEHVIPYLLREDVRLYVVCIGDGAKDAIECLDHIISDEPVDGLAEQLEAVALVQPYLPPTKLISEPFRNFLANRARSWVHSTLPFGKLVHTSALAKPIIDHQDAWNTETNHSDIDGIDESSASSTVPTSTAPLQQIVEDLKASSIMDGNNIQDTTATITTTLNRGVEDFNAVEDVEKNDSDASEAYEAHAQDEVVCSTFSAGNCDGITEIVFPHVMDEFLDFFWQVKAEAEELEARREEAQIAAENLNSSEVAFFVDT